MYSLISYPFYFKFLFAPIIDLYKFKIGKRKSYILPINMILSTILLYLSHADILNNLSTLWLWGLIICLFLGIQDVAIDGLATDLCKQQGESAALLQNIGFTIGNSFLGNFLFTALNQASFCTIETFFKFLAASGFMISVVTYSSLIEQDSEEDKRQTTFQDLINVIKSFFSNENMMKFGTLLFFDRTALSTLDATFRLKLVQFNVNKTYFSLIDIIILPLKIATSLIYHKYFNKYDFKYYGNIQGLRLGSTMLAIITLFLIDKMNMEAPYSYIAIFISNMCWWILFNITYIVRGNFQMRITTPGVEATTLTIMNSISQLGVKMAFSASLIMANYVNYYWLLIAGWIIHMLYCYRYSDTYKYLYMRPIQSWYLSKLYKQ